MVEFMVSITIMLILFAIALLNYNQSREEIALQRAAYKLAQDIRQVQEMASGAETAPGCFNAGQPIYPAYKYKFGINLKSADLNKYTLYSDCNGDNNYTGVDYVVPVELSDFNLVEISSDTFSAFGNLNILFLPPDLSVIIRKDADESSNSVSIVLQSKKDPNKKKSIYTNKAGLIDVQNVP